MTSNADIQIVAALEKLMQVQRILLWDVSKKEGLSPIQIQFLIYVGRYPEELCRVSSLAVEFDLTKATVSDAVSTLEDKGLLSKLREKEDKRSYVLRLTPKGKKLAERINGWQSALLRSISRFDAREKEPVMIFLMELIKSLFDDGVITVARMCIACENLKRRDGEGQPFQCRLTGRSIDAAGLTMGCEFYKSSRPE